MRRSTTTGKSRRAVAATLQRELLVPGYAAGHDLYEEVMQSLVEFAEEHPEAVPLIRGRTFARAVH